MKQDSNFRQYEFTGDGQSLANPEDFLSSAQRLDAIAEILATIALRAASEHHETPANE